ncbi:CASP-like protein 1D1 [Bidens hawaiensis]|uniref:CASP-like protein 1D1 n=1 Tax=Bidens hawaiensis TaxID=980011 RepID=UPI00404AECE8
MARINDTNAPPPAALETVIPVKFSGQALEQKASGADGHVKNHEVVIDAVLRAVVLVAGVAAVIVMVTSKQSKLVPLPFSPTTVIPLDANWNQSPTYIYFVAAFSTAGLYSIITGVASVLNLKKTGRSSTKLQFCFAILDSMLLAILSAAVGTELAVSWIGLCRGMLIDGETVEVKSVGYAQNVRSFFNLWSWFYNNEVPPCDVNEAGIKVFS